MNQRARNQFTKDDRDLRIAERRSVILADVSAGRRSQPSPTSSRPHSGTRPLPMTEVGIGRVQTLLQHECMALYARTTRTITSYSSNTRYRIRGQLLTMANSRRVPRCGSLSAPPPEWLVSLGKSIVAV